MPNPDHDQQRDLPFNEWKTYPSRNDLIIFRGEAKPASVDALPDMLITPFVSSREGREFGVGMHWKKQKGPGQAWTMEWDSTGADFMNSWRAMQVLSRCSLYAMEFPRTALAFVRVSEQTDSIRGRLINEYTQAIEERRELSPLELLYLALGRPNDVERIYREIMDSSPTADEIAEVKQRILEFSRA